MKKTAMVLIALMVVTASCKRLKQLLTINFTVPYDKAEFISGLEGNPTIPPSGARASVPVYAIATNSEEIISDNETTADLVTQVKLTQFNTKMLLPVGETFDLVDSLWIVVSGNNLAPQLLAYNYNVPRGAQEISLTPTDINLRDVFVEDTMYVKVEGFFREAPEPNSKILFDIKMKVTASVFQ